MLGKFLYSLLEGDKHWLGNLLKLIFGVILLDRKIFDYYGNLVLGLCVDSKKVN
jgi:hypothetical protein